MAPQTMKRKHSEAQISLVEQFPAVLSESEKPYAVAFKRLYFHLYSNSNSSRAERIIADLSNLLLCKIATERNGAKRDLDRFLTGEGTANALLLPILKKAFPNVVDSEERFA